MRKDHRLFLFVLSTVTTILVASYLIYSLRGWFHQDDFLFIEKLSNQLWWG